MLSAIHKFISSFTFCVPFVPLPITALAKDHGSTLPSTFVTDLLQSLGNAVIMVVINIYQFSKSLCLILLSLPIPFTFILPSASEPPR